MSVVVLLAMTAAEETKMARTLKRTAWLAALLLCVAGVRSGEAQPAPCSILIDTISVDTWSDKDRPAVFFALARLIHCNFSGPITYTWKFGDGDEDGKRHTWHKYTSGGTKTWTLTVDAPGVTASTSGQIDIGPTCQCVGIPGGVIGGFGGEAGEDVTFELVPPADCCQSGEEIEWSFGDGSEHVKGKLEVKHPYASAGTYHWYVAIAGGAGVTSGDVVIGPDLVADRIEVVQAVQDLKNSVRLVADKPTFVRFYVHSRKGYHLVSARLKVDRGDKGAYLYPINHGGKILVRPNPVRDALDHAFLFEVPSELLRGDDVSFEAEVNPGADGPILPSDFVPERDEGTNFRGFRNNTVEPHFAFETVPPLYLILYDVQWTTPDNRKIRQGDFHQSMLESWLRRAFPIPSLHVIRRSYDYATQHGVGVPQKEVVNEDLAQLRDTNSQWFSAHGIPQTARYYGMVWDGDDPAGFMQGRGKIPGFQSAGGAGVPTDAWDLWDSDGSWGDYYGAHEIGHNFGRRHPGTASTAVCKFQSKDPAGPVYPYPGARISGALSGDDAFYGFDALNHALYGTYWTDLMSYCKYRWISDVTFEGVMDQMQMEARGGGAGTAGSTTDRLVVVGTIHPATNTMSLQPLFILPNADEVEPRVPGPYAIVLRTAAGAELARYPFTPSESQGDPAPSQGSESAPETVLFADELVPYVAGTDWVDIEGPGGAVLKTVRAGANPPSVHVLSPNGGEVLSGATVPVLWTASDVDGDPLTFNVQYSRDDGSSWEMVAQNLKGTSVDLDAINIQAGSRARIRVWASDGIHTASDQSDGTFTIPNHVPTVSITQPATDITIAVGQTLTLQGDAYDIDTATMPGDFASSVDWSSDVDGYLGNTASLSLTLSEGVHTVTFSADDGRGGTASDTVRVTVVSTLAELPPIPDALAVAPALLVFDPAGGATSAAVAVDNQNAAHPIAWNATANDAWLQLSASTGVTPDSITVSFDGTGLAPGGYHGTVTFTSDAVPGVTQTIDAQVTVSGPPCAGDCVGDGQVTVDELLTMVNIALGNADVSGCQAGDLDGGGEITVDEILTAVNNALNGCPVAAPTHTPVATSSPVASPTGTPTVTMTAVASPTVTRTATVAPTVTPTRTPALPASATATHTPTGGVAHYCSDVTDQIDIPDDDPFGVASVLVINESLQINRLKISVWIEHSWVGDLVVMLTRLDNLATVTLVDRPGYPDSMFGCSKADILCEFVDESTVPAETECRTDLAALQGSLQPAEPLAVFSGSDLAGTWQLAVADLSAIGTGRLMQWCIDAD